MNKPRKFYKTTFTVEVLSEEPIPVNIPLSDLEHEFTHGSYSAGEVKTKEKVLTAKQAAKELQKQGSSAEFFMLDNNGKDIE